MTRTQITAARSYEYGQYRTPQQLEEDKQRRAAEREAYWARKEREAHKIHMLMRGMF